jgi:S-adenosylmethionine/arginine decarboxylase-like enzyme
MDDRIREDYERNGSWGISTSIDLHSCNPGYIRDAEKIKEFVARLCELIKTKRFGECTVIHFGERDEVAGFSMVQLIESSIISGHFANRTNNVYIDVFSCRYYNPEEVAEFSRRFFEAKDHTFKYILRK